jgi:membrane protein DedA with SNARE-associated domain
MRLLPLLAFSWMAWVHRFGGPGLIAVAIVDNSFIPIPGGLDVATILLSSSHREAWPYYGFMATLGAVLGGYLTFRLGRKGGKETLEKKIGRDKAEKVYQKFEKHGFSTIVVGSMIPPPFPIVPVLMAPGILKYPTRKFLAALALGRGIRYFAFAFIGHRYGSSILKFFNTYREPAIWTLIALAVLGGVAALVYFKYYRPKRRREERQAGEPVEELPIPGRGNQEFNQQQGTQSDDDDKERKSA